MTTPKCIVSKTYQGFVAKLHIPDDPQTQERSTKTVVFPTPILVVDTSGSMGHHAGRLIRKVLPDTLERLKYTSNTSVHLITFESSTRYAKLTCDELRKFGPFPQGGTNMQEVPKYLKDILKPSSHGYLILTVSDGGIWDQERTQSAACVNGAISSCPDQLSRYPFRHGRRSGHPRLIGNSATRQFWT